MTAQIFLFQLINGFATILYIAIFARVIISWINLAPGNPLVTLIYQVTEPILAPIRRVLPKMGMLDLSPMIALLLIALIQREILPRVLAPF